MLPSEFAELEPFAEKWCLATERERWDARMASSMDELQAFYDADLPRVPEAIAFCDKFPLDDMPDDAVNLLRLIYSFVIVSFPVELWRQPYPARHPRARLSTASASPALGGAMTTRAENELMTRIDGDAPMGRLMRENYWIPFAHVVAPRARRRRRCRCGCSVRTTSPSAPRTAASASSTSCAPTAAPRSCSARIEGNGVRCIYHGWKIDVSGCVVECPTQAVRAERFAASVPVVHFPVHECGRPGLGVARRRPRRRRSPICPSATRTSTATGACRGCRATGSRASRAPSTRCTPAMLHQTWIAEAAKMAEHANLSFALDQPPTYETEATPYGMRAAALRKTADGGRPTCASPSTSCRS